MFLKENRPAIAPVGVTVFGFRPFRGGSFTGRELPIFYFTGRYWPTFIYLFYWASIPNFLSIISIICISCSMYISTRSTFQIQIWCPPFCHFLLLVCCMVCANAHWYGPTYRASNIYSSLWFNDQ
jgi:hypothetical protein